MAASLARTPPLVSDDDSGSEPEEYPSQLVANDRNAHLQKFSDFVTSLYDSVKELIVKSCYGRYNSVHVLFLAWKTPNTHEITELAELEEIFKNKLGFTTERYDIGVEEVQESVQLKLDEVVRSHAGADELLIVYYAGYGRLRAHGRTTTLQPDRDSPAADHDVVQPLQWSVIENRLDKKVAKDSDILYILDSYYTPGNCRSSQGGKEVLASSQATGNYTYTTNLIHELQNRIATTSPIRVSDLHHLIEVRHRNSRIPAPSHHVLSSKASTSSIALASMEQDVPCIPIPLSDSQGVTLCKIRVKRSPNFNPEKWWEDNIVRGATVVEDAGLRVRPVDYVKFKDWNIYGETDVILVSMPSELSRKLAKKIRSQAFLEMKHVKSEADLTQCVVDEVWAKCHDPI